MELSAQAVCAIVFSILADITDICLRHRFLDVSRPLSLRVECDIAEFPGLAMGLLQIHLVPVALHTDVLVGQVDISAAGSGGYHHLGAGSLVPVLCGISHDQLLL